MAFVGYEYEAAEPIYYVTTKVEGERFWLLEAKTVCCELFLNVCRHRATLCSDPSGRQGSSDVPIILGVMDLTAPLHFPKSVNAVKS